MNVGKQYETLPCNQDPCITSLDSIRASLQADFEETEKEESLQNSFLLHKHYHHRSSSPDNDIMSTSSFVFDTRRSTPDCSLPTVDPVVASTVEENNESARYSSCMNETTVKRRFSREQDKEEIDDEGEDDAVASVLKNLPTGCTLERGTTIIQEQIETIITTQEEGGEGFDIETTNATESTSSLISEVNRSNSQHHHQRHYNHRNLLYEEDDLNQDSPFAAIELNLDEPAIRVAFPELGLDIVDLNYRSQFPKELEQEIKCSFPSSTSPSTAQKIRLTDLESWEENWLFQKKKNKPCNSINSYITLCELDFASEPVRMFIPNPCQVTQTQVGDQDVNHVQDLSERNSVASLAFSSDEEEEEERQEEEKEGGEREEQSQLPTKSLSETFAKSKSLSPGDRVTQHQHLQHKSSLTKEEDSFHNSIISSSSKMTQGLIKGKGDDHHHSNNNNNKGGTKKPSVSVIAANVKAGGRNETDSSNRKSNRRENQRESSGMKSQDQSSQRQPQEGKKKSSHDSSPVLIVKNGKGSVSNDSPEMKKHVTSTSTPLSRLQQEHQHNSKGKPFFIIASHKPPTSSSPPARKSSFSSLSCNQDSLTDTRDRGISCSSSGKISLPSFVPLNKRMESSRSDPCFVIKPCGASVQTDILVQFCCRVKGSRPLGVAWFKGDILLTNDNTFRIFSSGNEFILEIKSTKEDDSDTYSCVVYNGFGEQWADFNLSVKRVKERAPPVSLRTKTSEPTANTSIEQFVKPIVRGIDIVKKTNGSPKIITQTWAERSSSCDKSQVTRVGSSSTSGTKGRESPFDPRLQSSSSSSSFTANHCGWKLREESGRQEVNNKRFSSPVSSSSSEKLMKRSPVSWSDVSNIKNRSMNESHESNKVSINGINHGSNQNLPSHRPEAHYASPSEGGRKKTDIIDDSLTTFTSGNNNNRKEEVSVQKDSGGEVTRVRVTGPLPATQVKHQVSDSSPSLLSKEENRVAIISLTSKCKDLSVYKRDYFVPTSSSDHRAFEESLNGVEEKIYEPVKYFVRNSNEEVPQTETTVRAVSPANSNSVSESLPSRKSSKQEDDTDDEPSDQGVESMCSSPSVRLLVRRFSRKEGQVHRRNTFRSTNSIYDECNGKGVTPRTFASPGGLEVHSLTARSLGKHFRDQNQLRVNQQPMNRLASLSLYDIDHVPSSISPGESATISTGSPSNEGYTSDDSALGTNTKDTRKDKDKSPSSPVEIKPLKNKSRNIMKRASFWQKRCEKGLLSDDSVQEEFPAVDYVNYD